MIKRIHEQLINKEISATELTRQYLDRIKEQNPKLNAFITITEKEALASAEKVDQDISDGKILPTLAGIPASIKDIIMTKNVRTTGGSKILENYIAPYDATLVEQLKQNGLVLLGKNNCDEFACGGSNENSAYGPVKNPHDLERVSGGSSGGSATAVAADLSAYSIGTDTGGSVRQPSAFCGVVGLKPTYGTISRFGIMAMASSLDQAGVIAKSVEDAKIIFKSIATPDQKDLTNLKNYQLSDSNSSLSKIKIGIPKEYFVDGIDPEIKSSIQNLIDKLSKQGAEIVNINLPHTEYALAVYYIIMPAEVSSNLSRYDGIRYGQSKLEKDLIDIYKNSRANFLGSEVKRRIMLGTYVLSAGYYDAYYKKAQQVRTLIKRDFENAFNDKVDLILAPTTPHPAFKIGEKINDPLSMYLEDIFTVPINIAGLPAMSLPIGKTSAGLPIGAQLIAPWQSENILFDVGQEVETMLKNS